MIENDVNNNPSHDHPSASLNGRVVRLHFRCKAELPMGSHLRVTGSTLWAPGSSFANDPTNAHHISEEEASQGLPDGGSTGNQTVEPIAVESSGGDAALSTSSLYASTVELVTTPDTYPVWKTRRPVVVVLHKSHSQIQHHYYRYLVVTPGAFLDGNGKTGNDSGSGSNLQILEDVEQEETMGQLGGTCTVSKGDNHNGNTTVENWEDPYTKEVTKRADSVLSIKSALSVMETNGGTASRAKLLNLPYRTLDINVPTAKRAYKHGDEDGQIDTWNNPNDESFSPYLIRQAVNQEHRAKLSLNNSSQRLNNSSQSNNAIMDDGQDSGRGTPPVFPTQSRIFFICFHLPVVVVQNKETKVWSASWSESLLAKSEGGYALADYNAHWVGTVSTSPPISSEEDKEQVTSILADMDCTPVFLDPAVRQAHYYGFCKQVLWPAFHNIDLLDLSTSGLVGLTSTESSDWDQSRLDDWWKAYQDVNARFASVMGSMLRPNDILWIHDYHLSLLPMMMNQMEMAKFNRTVTRKVYFLHIPFPTSQIFRELECGESILEGMLHADVIGFHAFDHARHFLNAGKRILGLNYESLVGGLIGVGFRNKTVLVTMSNVSIEPKLIDAALMLPSVVNVVQTIKEKHNGKMIIGGVDVGQQLSGISLKFLAYERLLHDYPTWQGRVVLVQKVLISGTRKADEAFTIRELRALVKRIQDKFGIEVIDYQEVAGSSLPMDQRLALWKSCDILMSTPIREGLNHLPMEYVYARKEPERAGVVIASEFSAVCSILNGALRVNPYDIQMTLTTIDKALTMDDQEREGRRYRDIGFVSSTNSDRWVKNVLRDLREATQRTNHSNASSAVSTPRSGAGTPGNHGNNIPKEVVESTAGFLARESNLAFEHLKMRALKKAYHCTSRRVLLLDFNGTIVLKEPPGKYLKREILGTSGNKPPPEVIDALIELCKDPKNSVIVVSGDSSENVLNALGHIPGLGLAVSNGAQFSVAPILGPGEQPKMNNNHRQWKTFDLGVDWDAVKRVALPVLSKYTARSNGSFVKLTSFSIGWSYYSSDPEWGTLQASHLVLELETELKAYDVRFVTLKGIVEIVPRKLNKGIFVKKILQDVNRQSHNEGGVDFIACFGDDISDEKMFTSVFSFIAGQEDQENAEPSPMVINEDGKYDNPSSIKLPPSIIPDDHQLYSYTVAVGKKPSHASYYVNDAQDVANALVMLATGEMPPAYMGGGNDASNMFT